MSRRREWIEQIFEAALLRPQNERPAFLDRVCEGDAALRSEVENLLRDYDDLGSFLEKPLLNLRQENFQESDDPDPPAFSPDSSFFAPGDVIDERYRVVRFLARGGMGEVYDVEDMALHGVHVALKTIRPEIAGDPVMQARFKREVLAAREVIHPHLCPMYDMRRYHVESGSSLFFLTMKLLPGETLAARLKREGPITLPEADAIVHQIGSALIAAHNAEIVHRDIKPTNVILDGKGAGVQACLTDFGLARSLSFDPTQPTVIAGTPGYLAPELFQGQPPSRSSDIYALGVVAYEMLAGHLPALPLRAQNGRPADRDLQTLPEPWQSLILGCVEPDVSKRYPRVQNALEELDGQRPRAPLLTRRAVLRFGTGATLVLAGGVWLEWPAIDFVLHPLPDRRFVALMAWPPSENGRSAVLSMILTSIRNRLALAEAYVKDLLIISPSDVSASTGPDLKPANAPSSLGANLVLTASVLEGPSAFTLILQLLNAATQKTLRKLHISSPASDINALADQGSLLAARILGLPERGVPAEASNELRNITPAAYQEFSEGELLADQANSAGLDAAIDKYERAITLAPKFSLAYAKIAIAYIRKFLLEGEKASLDLASKNAGLALQFNPRSARGMFSQGLVYSYSGRTNDAIDYFNRALKLDPDNPDVLLYKAHTFRDLSRWSDEEKAYRDLLKIRPNYWPAYIELGWVLFRQARYADAASAFESASAAAPGVALPLADLSSIYLSMGKLDDAVTASRRSLVIYPNSDAYRNLGDIAFTRGNYQDALDNYQKAVDLYPNDHMIWRDIGDCYAMFGQPSMVRAKYAKAAELLADNLKTYPKGGYAWMTLAFYHAKIGAVSDAQQDLRTAEAQGASDVESQFMKAQALVLLGKKDDALKLILGCLDKGLSPVEVDLALDLKELREDARYKTHLAMLNSPSRKTAS
jgi:serine/threonine protein kinase/Tfp pilus assembly protein PilF